MSAAVPRLFIIASLLVPALAGCLDPAPIVQDARDGDDEEAPTVQEGVYDEELARTGDWSSPFDAEVPAINMILVHTGEVLYWSGVEAREEEDPMWTFFTSYPQEGESRVLDLSGDKPVVHVPATPHGAGGDLFCSGQTILPDGKVLTVGSSDWHTFQDNPDSPFLAGGADGRIYDPETRSWSAVSDMNLGRWYPSIITGADGAPLVASGIEDLTHHDDIWREWETWNQTEDQWSKVDGIEVLLPLYPRITLTPGGPYKGDVFYNTVGTLWGPFGEHPQQNDWSKQKVMDVEEGAWRDLPETNIPVRQHAASVMLPLDPERDHAPEFITFGGTIHQTVAAVPFTEHSDLATDPPTNTRVADMNHPRWHHNGVGLPNGKVLAIGGGLYDNVVIHGQENVPIMAAEVYDPETDTWTGLASMAVPRMYHSTALLLPDGRVLAGGHVPLPNPWPAARDTVNQQIVETRMEIFEPPYLFRGDRPVIGDAPGEIGYDETFEVQVALPTDRSGPAEYNFTEEEEPLSIGDTLESVVLVHPGATTHAYDSNQRTIELTVVDRSFDIHGDGAGTITLESPPDATVAPPGHYMLFVNAAHPDGAIPSEAAWVHIE